MALKKVYVGSLGPHLYDDAELVNDSDGLFPGETLKAVLSNGDYSIEGDLSVGGSVTLGDPTVDGSWRFEVSGTNLLIQRREGGTFVTKTMVTS